MFDRAAWRRRLTEMRGILESDRMFLLSGQIEKLAQQDRRRGAIEAALHDMPGEIAKAESGKIEHLKRLVFVSFYGMNTSNIVERPRLQRRKALGLFIRR